MLMLSFAVGSDGRNAMLFTLGQERPSESGKPPRHINRGQQRAKGIMSKRKEPGSYEVGYGKPPEDRQFKKGISGNPSGRPKKASDLESELIQELGSKVIMNENGKRKIIKKSEGLM